MNTLNKSEHSERAYIYKFLSECFYPPGSNIEEIIKNLSREITEFYPEMQKFLPEFNFDLNSLEVDFSRLFIGPFKLLSPPYGSVYIDSGNSLMGDSTIEVRNIYHDDGLICMDDESIPDHIAVELEYMYFLTCHEFNCHLNGDADRAASLREKQKYFLQNYLARWIFSFVKTVQMNAGTAFYKDIASLTEGFISHELRLMGDWG